MIFRKIRSFTKFDFLVLFVLCSFSLSGQIKNGVLICPDSTFQSLKRLSESRLKGGDILLFTTTHQDLAWAEHLGRCITWRDTLWLTPFINRLEKEPDFKMDVEQVSIVKEYIHRHPDKKEKINKYLKEGRICVGATYNQPYEELYSGESLARQFYLGQRWMQSNFDGYTSKSYFNVDVPGRTLQMPQIMQKAEVDNLVISRHGRGLFNWFSPDGSKVRTYSSGHYIFFYNVLAKEGIVGIDEFSREAELWYTKYNDVKGARPVMPAMLNYEFIWDQKPVENCIPFITNWNSIKEIRTKEGKSMKVDLPKFKYAIADDFYKSLDESTKKLPYIEGERPNVWLYIHGPSHERAITASRKADVLLPRVEKLGVFSYFADNNFNMYPAERLNNAWEDKIYPDHGWGGQGGDITDAIFEAKYVHSLSESEAMEDLLVSHLSQNVKTELSKGLPLILFNDLSWKRNGVVVRKINLEQGFAKNINVFTHDGKKMPSQLAEVERYKDGSLKVALLYVVVDNIPSMGQTTCYIRSSNQALNNTNRSINRDVFENRYYKIDFSRGGIQQIFDKELGVDLIDNSKFKAGEVITMRSVGNGAGEFDEIQQPDMEGFDKTSLNDARWEITEQGDVFTAYKYRVPIKHAVVEQTVRVYEQIKKIDVDISLLNWDNTLYREFRMMLPLAMEKATVKYEVPYGILTVGKDEMAGGAGERYLADNRKIHPRGILNWISASDDKVSVTLSSSVAAADFIDPTTTPSSNVILQPILMASRRSCHGGGNEYLLIGDHHFEFSITSSSPNDVRSNQFGLEANSKIKSVFNPRTYNNASLQEELSFLEIDNENVVVSALKKCEDDDSIVVRLYNLKDSEQAVRIRFPREIGEIIQTNIYEKEMKKVSKIILKPYAIETFKIKLR